MKTLVAGIVGILTMGFFVSAAAEDNPHVVPSLTVVGAGKVSAKPDMAQITLGVVTDAPQAAKALADNNEAMTKLFSSLDGLGIARKDVQTSNFSVVPQYRRGPRGEQQPEIVAYRVSNAVRVKVRKLESLGQILDEVVHLGANQIQGIGFSVAEPAPLLDAARRQAVADARRKAELFSKEAGVSIDRVLTIQEGTARVPRPPMMGLARPEAAVVPIAEGEMDFEASVTVTYAIGGKPSTARGSN